MTNSVDAPSVDVRLEKSMKLNRLSGNIKIDFLKVAVLWLSWPGPS